MLIRNTIPSDFLNIELQAAQYISPEVLKNWDPSLLLTHPAWTLEDDGKIYFIGGICKVHNFRYVVWAFVSKYAGKCLFKITKEVKKVIDSYRGVRVEANVSPSFQNGHQWARMLGFKLEGILKCYAEDGSDMAMYGKINIHNKGATSWLTQSH